MNSNILNKLSNIVHNAINEAFDFNDISANDNAVVNDLPVNYIWLCDLLYKNFKKISKLDESDLEKFENELYNLLNTPGKIEYALKELIEIDKQFNIIEWSNPELVNRSTIYDYNVLGTISNKNIIQLFKKGSAFIPTNYYPETLGLIYLLTPKYGAKLELNFNHINKHQFTPESFELDNIVFRNHRTVLPLSDKLYNFIFHYKCDIKHNPELIELYYNYWKEREYKS